MVASKIQLGSLSHIVEMLRTADAHIEMIPDAYYGETRVYIRLGSTPVADQIMRDHRADVARLEAEHKILPHGKDNLLCKAQERQRANGYRPYTSGTNIYGWCAGSTMLSNMGGGRFSATPRGWTLEQVIEWACEQVKVPETRFELFVGSLDERNVLRTTHSEADRQIRQVYAALTLTDSEEE